MYNSRVRDAADAGTDICSIHLLQINYHRMRCMYDNVGGGGCGYRDATTMGIK